MTRTLLPPGASLTVRQSSVRLVLSDLQRQLITMLSTAENGLTTVELVVATAQARTQPVVPALTSLRSRRLVDHNATRDAKRVWTLTERARGDRAMPSGLAEPPR